MAIVVTAVVAAGCGTTHGGDGRGAEKAVLAAFGSTPHHILYEPVSVPRGVITTESWDLDGSGCPGQEDSEMQSCDPPPPLWVVADVRVCALGAAWDVAPEDFRLETVDGQSFAGEGTSGDWFAARRVLPGHCAEGSFQFGPIGNAVANAYNPPTFVFRQDGTPTVKWTEPAEPAP
jgi:hypothetical protein